MSLNGRREKSSQGICYYRAFSQGLGPIRPSDFLFLLKCSGFDFDRNLQVSSNSTLVPLSPDVSTAIKSSFTSVAHTLNPNMELHGKQIMAMERIQGENFYDFAKSKYAGLDNSQKKELFYKFRNSSPWTSSLEIWIVCSS